MDMATYKKAENVKKYIDNIEELVKMINDGNDITICCGNMKLNIDKSISINCRNIIKDHIRTGAAECLMSLTESFEKL